MKTLSAKELADRNTLPAPTAQESGCPEYDATVAFENVHYRRIGGLWHSYSYIDRAWKPVSEGQEVKLTDLYNAKRDNAEQAPVVEIAPTAAENLPSEMKAESADVVEQTPAAVEAAPEIPEPALDPQDTQKLPAIDGPQLAPITLLVLPNDEPSLYKPLLEFVDKPAEITAPAPTLDAVLGVPAPVAVEPAQDIFTVELLVDDLAAEMTANTEQAAEIARLTHACEDLKNEVATLHDQLEKERKISTQARADVRTQKATIKAQRDTLVSIRQAFSIDGELTVAKIIDAVRAMPLVVAPKPTAVETEVKPDSPKA